MSPTQNKRAPPLEGALMCHPCSQSKAFPPGASFVPGVCTVLVLRQGGLAPPTILWDGPSWLGLQGLSSLGTLFPTLVHVQL